MQKFLFLNLVSLYRSTILYIYGNSPKFNDVKSSRTQCTNSDAIANFLKNANGKAFIVNMFG